MSHPIVSAVYKNYEQQAFSTIDGTLEKSFKKMLRNASITFIITLSYVFVKIFQPFSTYSNLIAKIILFGNTIWFAVRIIIYFCKYGKIIIPGLKHIKKEKNVRSSNFINNDDYPVGVIEKTYSPTKSQLTAQK